jgi:hypothetical protein
LPVALLGGGAGSPDQVADLLPLPALELSPLAGAGLLRDGGCLLPRGLVEGERLLQPLDLVRARLRLLLGGGRLDKPRRQGKGEHG